MGATLVKLQGPHKKQGNSKENQRKTKENLGKLRSGGKAVILQGLPLPWPGALQRVPIEATYLTEHFIQTRGARAHKALEGPYKALKGPDKAL